MGAAFWGVAGASFRSSLRPNSDKPVAPVVASGGEGGQGGRPGPAGQPASRPGQPASQGGSQALLSPGGFCGLGGHSWPQSLCRAMPERLQELVKKKGERLKH